MEQNKSDEFQKAPQQESPRMVFKTTAGKEFNLADELNGKSRFYMSSSEDKHTGDYYAFDLIDLFSRRYGVREELYRKTMPKLFEWAAKKEGGFDEDFLAVTERVLDTTCAKMNVGDSYRRDAYGLREEDRPIYYAWVYGQVEAIKEFIWDDPAMAEKKKQLVEAAKRSMLLKYGRNEHHPLAFPDRAKDAPSR